MIDIEHYCRRFEHLYARQEPFSTVVDMRRVRVQDSQADRRKRLAEEAARLDSAFGSILVSEAIVVPDAKVRGLYTAYKWQKQRTPFETRMFDDLDDALDWTRRELSSAGLKLPNSSG